MLDLLERPEAAVAKKRGRPATSDRDDVPVKVDRQVAADLRRVAEYRGIHLAEFVTEILRPIAAKEFARYLKEREGAKD